MEKGGARDAEPPRAPGTLGYIIAVGGAGSSAEPAFESGRRDM